MDAGFQAALKAYGEQGYVSQSDGTMAYLFNVATWMDCGKHTVVTSGQVIEGGGCQEEQKTSAALKAQIQDCYETGFSSIKPAPFSSQARKDKKEAKRRAKEVKRQRL